MIQRAQRTLHYDLQKIQNANFWLAFLEFCQNILFVSLQKETNGTISQDSGM